MPGGRVTIRPAATSDVAAAAALLRLRDGRDYPLAAVERCVAGFHPERSLGWIAFDEARPAGLSMVYRRTLTLGATRYPVGYWAHLFVDPEYRKAMVYPRLPLAMFRGAQQAGMAFVLTVARRAESSGAYLQLGCRQLGELPVLMKPLRPARLLAQRRGWSWARGPATALPDAVYGGLLAAWALPASLGGAVEEIDWSSPAVEELAALRNEAVAHLVHEERSAAALRERFATHLDGDRYRLLVARDGGGLAAAAVYRLAVRSGTRAGVLMSAWCRGGRERALARVLVGAERRCGSEGAEVMLHLGRGAGSLARALPRLGYIGSPERYRLLVWPKSFAPADGALLDAAKWSFDFSDHDAF